MRTTSMTATPGPQGFSAFSREADSAKPAPKPQDGAGQPRHSVHGGATSGFPISVGTPVIDSDGKQLGHLVELRIGRRHHRVNTILIGSYGWAGRLGLGTLLHRLGWWGQHDERAVGSRREGPSGADYRPAKASIGGGPYRETLTASCVA